MLVEVKHTGRESGRWDLDGLEDHQADTLAAHHRAGALCLVLVVGNGPADLFAVPWPVVAEARRLRALGGAASLSAEQLAPHRCPPGRPYLARFLSKGAP